MPDATFEMQNLDIPVTLLPEVVTAELNKESHDVDVIVED